MENKIYLVTGKKVFNSIQLRIIMNKNLFSGRDRLLDYYGLNGVDVVFGRKDTT